MKTVLVTGANGQLGKSIHRIASNYPELKFIFTDVADLDITNSEAVDAFFQSNKIAYCINCAAYTAVDKAEEAVDKAFLINATAVKNLAESCRNSGTVLIHVSTDFVFDGTKETPYTEEDTPNPLSVYGKSKLKGEAYIQEIWDKHFIVRTSWLYSEYGNNFVKTMLRLAETRDEISVVNDQIGSPTYAGDLASFLLEIIHANPKKYGIYHYSNEGSISWYDFACEIFKIKKIKKIIEPINSAEFKLEAERPKFSVLDMSLAAITLNASIKHWKKSLLKSL